MLSYLIILISISMLLYFIYYIQKKNEGFLNSDNSLIINNECKFKTDECNDDISLIPLNCNKIPNSLEINQKSLNSDYNNFQFNNLVPTNGKYTFIIPELKYDGIFSRKIDNNNKCCWSLEPNVQETYGSNNFLHINNKSMYNKTIISSPECAGYHTGYSPAIYLNECNKAIPNEVSYKYTI